MKKNPGQGIFVCNRRNLGGKKSGNFKTFPKKLIVNRLPKFIFSNKLQTETFLL